MRRHLPFAAVLLLAGCSESDLMDGAPDSDAAPENDTGDGLDSDDAETDTDLKIEVVWWTVRGTVAIVGGEPDLPRATLTAEYRDTLGTACEAGITILEAAPVAAPPAPIGAAWTFQLAPTTAGACGVRALAPITFGIGTIDPQLHPAMDRAGYPPASTKAYGLYADPGTGWVAWGLAGNAAQLAGEAEAAALPPLADDTYTWVPLFLLPLVSP